MNSLHAVTGGVTAVKSALSKQEGFPVRQGLCLIKYLSSNSTAHGKDYGKI